MKDAVALTPDLLMHAYSVGIFPMAETRDDPELFWVDPQKRGVLPLEGLHISRSLRRRMRRSDVTVSLNRAFDLVVQHCADRPETWINGELNDLYMALHHQGHAHSLEVWYGDTLAGGVFGVAQGGAFFGESMFSAQRDGSKIALAILCDHLFTCGFRLFDTQFITPHLASLGGAEITRREYLEQLTEALLLPAKLDARIGTPQGFVQRITQTS